MEIPKHFIFFSYDGDGIGRKIGRAVLDNDIDTLRRTSNLIEAGHDLIKRWVKEKEGIWIEGGGDEGMAAIPKEHKEDLERVRKDYEYLVGATSSMGVGKNPSEAGRALLVAKLKGKNRIVHFNKETEKEIREIKKRAKKGALKSMDEYKLTEAYLSKSEHGDEDDCEYCKQTDGVDKDHCKYCHDVDPQENEENCPYCKFSQEDPMMPPDRPEIAEMDCQYCKERDKDNLEECQYCKEVPSLVSPDSNNESAPAGSDKEKEQYEKMGMNPPVIGKPNPNEESPIEQNPPLDKEPDEITDPEQQLSEKRDVPSNDKTSPGSIGVDPEDNHSQEALHAIAEQIEAEESPSGADVNQIGEEDVGSGQEMEGNVSRPIGYKQNTPSDTGLQGPNVVESGSDEPNLQDILQEGLDEHSGNIQKEKTIQMISQALSQFKASKQSLELAREQMPELYQASLGILKAMIGMAGMLNLNGGQGIDQSSSLGQEQQNLTPEQSAEVQPIEENEWNDPFPTHPDNGGKKDVSDSSQEEKGIVGQPIGKLPTKETTEHVARNPMPVGSVNVKGQKKVMDSEGNIRFINMKQGMVLGPSGVPVKPEKR